MKKSADFYLKAIIKDRFEREIPSRERKGLFRHRTVKHKKYYILCELPKECTTDKVNFQIEVTKDHHDKLDIGNEVSIHVKVEYQYCCLHLDEPKPTTVIGGKESIFDEKTLPRD